jgi:hypothetical protein
VSNGGIVPISKEQYLQLNTRPKRTSKVGATLCALPNSPLRALHLWRDACHQEAMAFSAVLLAALATGKLLPAILQRN